MGTMAPLPTMEVVVVLPTMEVLPPPGYPLQHINPAEDPLAAFEAAMAKLDREKASRGRGTHSPSRAYRATRSRSRERYRDYREFSPRRRSPGLRRSPPRGPH